MGREYHLRSCYHSPTLVALSAAPCRAAVTYLPPVGSSFRLSVCLRRYMHAAMISSRSPYIEYRTCFFHSVCQIRTLATADRYLRQAAPDAIDLNPMARYSVGLVQSPNGISRSSCPNSTLVIDCSTQKNC